jgi:hypothetical protein
MCHGRRLVVHRRSLNVRRLATGARQRRQQHERSHDQKQHTIDNVI